MMRVIGQKLGTCAEILVFLAHPANGVTRIFRPMGKLRLCRRKTMGKTGKTFIDGPNKVLITYKKNWSYVPLIRHASNSDRKPKSDVALVYFYGSVYWRLHFKFKYNKHPCKKTIKNRIITDFLVTKNVLKRHSFDQISWFLINFNRF
jgi:hypothetical protein